MRMPIVVMRSESVGVIKMSQSNRLGLLGRKIGMTRFFTDDGESVPVTVIDVANNRVAQVKNQNDDGYDALQVVYGVRRRYCKKSE